MKKKYNEISERKQRLDKQFNDSNEEIKLHLNNFDISNKSDLAIVSISDLKKLLESEKKKFKNDENKEILKDKHFKYYEKHDFEKDKLNKDLNVKNSYESKANDRNFNNNNIRGRNNSRTN